MVMMPCNTFQFTLYLCLIHVLYTGLRFLLIQFITDLIRGHHKNCNVNCTGALELM